MGSQMAGVIMVLSDDERVSADQLFVELGELPEQKVVQPWRNEITAKNIRTLRDGTWLNDNVINQFQELV